MELSGLILAVIVAAITFYALPNRIARRYAVVTSREGDRFSPDVALVTNSFSHNSMMLSEANEVGRHQGFAHGPSKISSRPLLATSSASDLEGASVAASPTPRSNEKSTKKEGVGSISDAPRGRADSKHPAREYAALRASRAARLSRQSAAAQRRLVTASVAGISMLVFIGLSVAGVIGWLWLVLPGAFLAGTLGSSMMAGEKARRENADELTRLTELKEALSKGKGKNQGKAESSRDNPASVREKDSSESGSAQKRTSRPRVLAQSSLVEKPAEEKRAEDKAEGADHARGSAADHQASAKALEEDESKGVKAIEIAENIHWDVVPLPPVRHASTVKMPARVVHADTDIRGVPTAGPKKNVPARPLRKSGTKSVEVDVEQLPATTGSGLRFDLDAVLDQRRAQ